MAFEPRGFEFGVSRHDDFEGALAEFDVRDLVDGQGEGFFDESVEVVDVPVEFFLERDHAAEERGGSDAGGMEALAGGCAGFD